MKRIFITLLCFSSLAFGQTASVTGFDFNYRSPFGAGKAQNFSMSAEELFSAVEIQVEKIDQDFSFKVSGGQMGEYLFKGAPSFMTNAETMNVKNLNLDLSDRASVSVDHADFISPDDKLVLSRFTLDCVRHQQLPEVMDQLISGCVQKMHLKSSKFSSSGQEEDSFAAHFSEAVVEALQDGKSSLSGVGVSSLELKVNAGRYELAAEVKADVSGKVRSLGTLAYNAQEKILTIRINEVKFSILNVTSKVFDELKKKESDKMRVRPPYVYLTLK
jgi:hypothetical protein